MFLCLANGKVFFGKKEETVFVRKKYTGCGLREDSASICDNLPTSTSSSLSLDKRPHDAKVSI